MLATTPHTTPGEVPAGRARTAAPEGAAVMGATSLWSPRPSLRGLFTRAPQGGQEAWAEQPVAEALRGRSAAKRMGSTRPAILPFLARTGTQATPVAAASTAQLTVSNSRDEASP